MGNVTRKNGIVFILMLLVGVSVFWWSMRSVKPVQFFHSLASANWWWLLVAVGAMLLYFVLEAAVNKVFVDTVHGKMSWHNAIRVPLVEQLGNGITPFATGGQPMQLIAMAQTGIDPGRAGSILLMKFVVYQGMIVLNFLMALTIGYNYIATKLHALALLVILGFIIHMAVIVVLLLVMYLPRLTHTLMHWIMIPVRWLRPKKVVAWSTVLSEKVDSFHDESRRMSHNWPALLKAIALTFVQLFFYYLIPYFILLAMGVSHINVMLVTSLHILIVMVISLFPIPGGAGGAEVSFQMLFNSFLPTAAELVLVMVIWRLITYYLGMFLGIVAFNISVKKDNEQ